MIPSTSTGLPCPDIFQSSSSPVDLDFFKTESSWDAVASARALLNAPLNKRSCSDAGVNRHFQTHAAQHRRPKADAAEQNLVTNLTSCCTFGGFVNKRYTWRNLFL